MGKSLHFDHVRLRPSEQMGLHEQPTWELSLIVEGEGTRTIGTQTDPFHPGDVVLVPPNLPHQWQFADNGQLIENMTLMFAPSFLRTTAMAFPEMETALTRLSELAGALAFTGKTRERLAEGLRQMPAQSEAMRVATLLRMLILIAETDERRSAGSRATETDAEHRRKQVEIFVTCNYKCNITIDDVAQHVGMNRSALCTFFHRQTGKTIIGYLNEVRLGMDCHLLRRSTHSIQQICYESGFNDVPHFCRTFKKAFGLTPKEFRLPPSSE